MADYRIDDLAREADTTVRNIRAYQERGLLPPPARRGRVAIYSEVHLARLRLIGRLLDRGLPLAAIGDLVEWWESGHSVEALLGLEEALVAPWTDDAASHLSIEELQDLFGGEIPVGAIEQAVALGVLEVGADGTVVVRAPRLLRIAADLVAEGVPLPAVLETGQQLRRAMDAVAELFVGLVAEHLIAPELDKGIHRLGDVHATEAARLVQRLRPLARMAVDAMLVTSLDREIDDQVTRILATLSDEVRSQFSSHLR